MNDNEFTDILKVQGVNAKGYGTIPKIVMQDSRLTIQAKAIYSYFCSFAGAGDTAFPTVKKIMKDLGIKDIHTFSKHRNLLVDCGYIKFIQVVKNGVFGSNVYTLISNPEPKEIENKRVLPSVKNSHTEFTECEKTRVGKNPSRKKSHTKRNSIIKSNNIYKNNQSVNDGQTDKDLQKIIQVAEVYHYPESTAMFIENVIATLWTEGSMKTKLKMNLTFDNIKDRLRLCRLNHIDTAMSKMASCKTNKELYFAKCLLTAIVESNMEGVENY